MPSREQYLIEQAEQRVGMTRTQLSRVQPALVVPVRSSAPGASPTLEQVFALGRVQPSMRSWISGAPNEIVRSNNPGGSFSGGLRNAQGSW